MGETIPKGGGNGRAGRPRRVLVVECAHQRRIYAAQLLAELGFRVILAVDAEEAALTIARQGARLDAVLLGERAEGREMIEAAAAAHRPELDIIELTSEGYSAATVQALLGGPRDAS